MDQYLARKKKNSVHYEEVPKYNSNVRMFVKTWQNGLYVWCARCDVVRRARKAVDTPIDDIEKMLELLSIELRLVILCITLANVILIYFSINWD